MHGGDESRDAGVDEDITVHDEEASSIEGEDAADDTSAPLDLNTDVESGLHAIAKSGTDNAPDISVTVEDERLCIPLNVKTKEGTVSHNLYFNPVDMHIYQHLAALDKLRGGVPEFDMENLDPVTGFIEQFDYHFDGIFGAGSCREVFRYIGFKMSIWDALFERIVKGVEWHNGQSKKQEAKARKQAMLAAKAESKAFFARQS